MKVTLIGCTPNAMEILIFTKGTRLEMTPHRFEVIANLSNEQKLEELAYMANTIPSSWEFVDYTFSIEGVSRGFTHQWVRTRPNSNAQQSMRVTNMGGFDYVTGPTLKRDTLAQYNTCMGIIKEVYRNLIEDGVAIEDARGILPTNIKTNIVTKINLRMLSDMVKSRSGGRTQNEYREVMGAISTEVLKVHPWADLFLFPKGRDYFDDLEKFKDVVPQNMRQNFLKIIDKMRKHQ